jgi:hypothetical protein
VIHQRQEGRLLCSTTDAEPLFTERLGPLSL